MEAFEDTGIPFGIIDLSLAPTPAPVGWIRLRIFSAKIGLDPGAPGTTGSYLLNDQVKKGGVMASSYVLAAD